ncbi:SprT-like domain-containing protein [Spiroplasma endosymbiont of Diplazon laetatorius]|uniref:SprT-like domain-containing protein n=1 Tax=Spiroplasma endosymbiont of Diplazon laetatorius TaxID=3066322 RepID=UPI0030CEDE95
MEYRIDDLILELHSIHKQLNDFLFSSTLSDIKIAIETSKRRNSLTLGHFDPSQDWSDNKNQITIWTLTLNGDYIRLIGVLVHEMVHQFNHERGIKDVENNQRHNKKFKEAAIAAKLNVSEVSSKAKGFNNTSVSQELRHYIENKLDFNKDLFKKMIHKDALSHEPKGYNKSNKYICGCGTVINNSRIDPLKIKCLECNKVFEKIN